MIHFTGLHRLWVIDKAKPSHKKSRKIFLHNYNLYEIKGDNSRAASEIQIVQIRNSDFLNDFELVNGFHGFRTAIFNFKVHVIPSHKSFAKKVWGCESKGTENISNQFLILSTRQYFGTIILCHIVLPSTGRPSP